MFQHANRSVTFYSNRAEKVPKAFFSTLLGTSARGYSKARRSLLRARRLSNDIFSILIIGSSWCVESIHSKMFHLLLTKMLDQPEVGKECQLTRLEPGVVTPLLPALGDSDRQRRL